MRAVLKLLLALCPAASSVRLAGGPVDPRDARLAQEARAKSRPRDNACKATPKMCEGHPGMGRHTAAAVVSAFQEDLRWLNEMPWSDNLTVMVHDRSGVRSHGSKNKFSDRDSAAEESEAAVKALNLRRTRPIRFQDIPNKGDEAAAYLTWIVNNYDRLPDVSFFLQGNRCDDHAEFDMSVALPSIRQCFRPEQGYLSIAAYSTPGTKCKWVEDIQRAPATTFHIDDFSDVWTELFYLELGPEPTRFCWDAFGSFAVSRDAIRRHPVDFYKMLHQAVLSGRTSMEYFWRAVFVKDAISWEEPPKKDRNGRLIKPEYVFTKEEELENARHVDPLGQVLDPRNPL